MSTLQIKVEVIMTLNKCCYCVVVYDFVFCHNHNEMRVVMCFVLKNNDHFNVKMYLDTLC